MKSTSKAKCKHFSVAGDIGV